MDEVFKNLPLAEQKKMLDHLAKLPDVRFLSSEEREKYDESVKAVMIGTSLHIPLVADHEFVVNPNLLQTGREIIDTMKASRQRYC